MRKFFAAGVIKAGKLVELVTVSGEKLEIANPPRSESLSHMVPVIRNGKVIGYQDLFGSDMAIYDLVKEVK